MTYEEALSQMTGDLKNDLYIMAGWLKKSMESNRKEVPLLASHSHTHQAAYENMDYAYSMIHLLINFSEKKRISNELFSQKDWQILEISDEHKNHSVKPELTKSDPAERHAEAMALYHVITGERYGSFYIHTIEKS